MKKIKAAPLSSLTPILVLVPFYIAMIADDFSGASKGIFILSALYTIVYCIKRPNFTKTLLQPAHIAGGALILFVALSGLWGEGERADRYLRYGAFLYLFWVMINIVAQAPKQRLTQVATLLLAVTCLAAFYGVISHALSDNAPARNRGPGMLQHPILGSSVLIAMGATGVMLLQALKKPHGIWAAATFIAVLAYTLTTQSRGPLLAVLAWGLMLTFTCSHGKTLKTMMGALVLIAVSVTSYFGAEHVDNLLKRGTSHRLTIWQHTLPQIQKHPIIGHGITLDFTLTSASKELETSIGKAIEHPHNLMLATLIYTGITGLALLLVATTTGAITLFRKEKKTALLLLPVFTAIFLLSLTDLSKLVTEPSPIWFIFWLPIGFIAGLSSRTISGKPAQPREH